MSAPDFASFYQAIHGRDPFPWQSRLANRVLENGWPGAIDVPTGCGKTSVLDIGVYTLAVNAGRPFGERPPLRMFFIVDRRLVVDDVFAHAQKIASALETGKAEPLDWARKQLCLFDGALPLDVAQLRGGMYRSDAWAEAPNQPLICVSTVDQVGSRLLFRGYGVSGKMRPVHAGLVGNDALYILDEAHLSNPFLETLQAVGRYQTGGWVAEKIAPGIRVVEMSATRRKDATDSFHVEDEDWKSEALKPRLEAAKIARLRETRALAETAAEEARALGTEGVFGVVLNTVQAARDAFELLRANDECILLTGRVRPYDRDRILEKHKERIESGAKRTAGQRLFVVATQTVEVGADLDFDGLVTEAAPLDSLRQRFGRLNRLGRNIAARAVILRDLREASSWIYGESLTATWKWLKEKGEEVDFGVRAMNERLKGVDAGEYMPKQKSAPVLFPAHLEAWAQTNPAPAVDPDVAPFLHGGDSESADVQIVWRADLEDSEDPGYWVEQLRDAPPVPAEALAISISAARKWLARRVVPVADVEGAERVEAVETKTENPGRAFLIWRGPDDYDPASEISRIRPGDTIVVRSGEGGCDEYGWHPASTAAVSDIGDRAANAHVALAGGRYRTRVHPAVLKSIAETVRDFASAIQSDEPVDDSAVNAIKQESGARLWGTPRRYGRNSFIVTSRFWTPKGKRAPVQRDEEEGDLASFTTNVFLDEHIEGVTRMTRRFLKGCGINGGVSQVVIAAAERHDWGKLDLRFQFLLSPKQTGRPLAKGEGDYREYRSRKAEAAYPDGARHEFVSVALAENCGEWDAGVDGELALYLIGTHHGYGRPFPPAWNDSGYEIEGQWNGRTLRARDVHRVGRLGSGWAERYTAMTRRFGWWGLAYLEAILRRADGMQSRKEEEAHERA